MHSIPFMNILNRLLGKKTKIVKEATSFLPNINTRSFRAIELIHYSNCTFLLDNIYTKEIDNTAVNNKYHALLEGNEPLPFETISCKIEFFKIKKIIKENGLKSINTFIKEGYGTIACNENMRVFGNSRFAIVCEIEEGYIKHLWVTGKELSNSIKTDLERIFISFGVKLDLMAIQWLNKRYFFLYSPDYVKEFIRHSF